MVIIVLFNYFREKSDFFDSEILSIRYQQIIILVLFQRIIK